MTKQSGLLFLCWALYTCSLIGKVNYSACIPQVIDFYGVRHDQAGMVSTFFFFAYGAGQIINGLFCKKYNIKLVVFLGMTLSGGANLFVALTKNFTVIKYLWAINGFGVSVLWPCLVRLISETFPRKSVGKASVIMGTTTATGTLVIYGLSSIFAAFNAFKLSFFTAAVALPAMGLIWFLSYDKLAVKVDDEEECVYQAPTAYNGEKKRDNRALVCVCLLGLIAVATNLIKDGLTTWVPSILKETYGLNDSLSVLLTLFLPVLAIFGNATALWLYHKAKDFIAVSLWVFSGIALLIGVVIGFLSIGVFVVTLASFAIVCLLASASNSNITSICPLYMKGKFNSGMLAGLLNGCCYVGSAISSYGLGVVRTYFGWNAVFYLLLGSACVVVLISVVYLLIGKALQAKKQKNAD